MPRPGVDVSSRRARAAYEIRLKTTYSGELGLPVLLGECFLPDPVVPDVSPRENFHEQTSYGRCTGARRRCTQPARETTRTARSGRTKETVERRSETERKTLQRGGRPVVARRWDTPIRKFRVVAQVCHGRALLSLARPGNRNSRPRQRRPDRATESRTENFSFPPVFCPRFFERSRTTGPRLRSQRDSPGSVVCGRSTSPKEILVRVANNRRHRTLLCTVTRITGGSWIPVSPSGSPVHGLYPGEKDARSVRTETETAKEMRDED